MKKDYLAVITVLALLFIACNQTAESDNKAARLKREQQQAGDHYTGDQTAADSISGPQQADPQQALPAVRVEWDKKIIKTAGLIIEVKDYKSYSQQLAQKVRQLGGYISHEKQNQTDYLIENLVTIRVPADRFEDALGTLSVDAIKVMERTVTSQDVTGDLVDGRARLEAKKQVRLRYLDLLKAAKNIQEILTVQKEIDAIQEDIELVNGRISSLGLSSAMSTIDLNYSQALKSTPKETGEAGFSTKVKMAFANGWSWIRELLLILAGIWPLLLLAIFTFLYFRRKNPLKLK